MKLSEKAIQELRTEKVRMKIALDLDIGFQTFRFWILKNHKNLTLKQTIKIIKKHTGLKENEIFEEQTQTA